MVRTPEGLYFRASPARLVDAPLRRLMAEKLIRGLHYAETGVLALGRRHGPREDAHQQARAAGVARGGGDPRRHPAERQLGPGFSYGRLHATKVSLWAFLIWGQVLIIAFAVPPGLPLEGAAGAQAFRNAFTTAKSSPLPVPDGR